MPTEEFPHLMNAPIKEALIDLKVQLPSSITVADFSKVFEKAKDLFPHDDRLRMAGLVFDAKERTARQIPEQTVGIALWSEDHSRAIHLTKDGYSYHILRPYSEWSDFCSDALKWWNIYVEEIKPPIVTRIGVRFINRIVLPEPDLDKYFVFTPTEPKGIEGMVPNFIQQMRYVLEDGKEAIITQALDANGEGDRIAVFFDIDTYKDVSILPNDSSIEATLESLHLLKNQIFFNNVKPEAIKLWQ